MFLIHELRWHVPYWSFCNRNLPSRDPHFQGSNDFIRCWCIWLQIGRAYRGGLMALSVHSATCIIQPWLTGCKSVSACTMEHGYPQGCQRFENKSKSPPWVGSTLSCNLWAGPREPVSGTFRSVEQLLKCNRSIFDSIELIMKSVPASSLIIFEILI